MSGVKGIIGMHRFNICLVFACLVAGLSFKSCSGVKTPLQCMISKFVYRTSEIITQGLPPIIMSTLHEVWFPWKSHSTRTLIVSFLSGRL